jgi:hypothetical protein
MESRTKAVSHRIIRELLSKRFPRTVTARLNAALKQQLPQRPPSAQTRKRIKHQRLA